MPLNKEAATVLDKGVYIIHDDEELKTTDTSKDFNLQINVIQEKVKNNIRSWPASAIQPFIHFCSLITLGLLIWGLLWCAWGEGWSWKGQWFRLAIVAVIAWSTGQILQGTTTLPPLLAALLTGTVARNLGYLNMQEFPTIDGFLRKIYPVIILGKSSLGWDVTFMKKNWWQVSTLGVLPWSAEVATLAICMRYFMNYPWIWGVLLGSIYASLSCAIVMPTVLKFGTSPDRTHHWPQLICTAGGIDTALSVGVYGVVYSFIFSDVDETYRCTKAAMTLFVGVAIGVAWGSLAKLLPHKQDMYVTELRVLFVLLGGLFGNFFTLHFGWGGAGKSREFFMISNAMVTPIVLQLSMGDGDYLPSGGVAVLACNATAAKHWERDGWKLNNNPASTVYRILWASLEPVLFAYTGTYFVIENAINDSVLMGFGILLICLVVRLTVAALTCWNMTLKEKLFICCAWTPKSIVEAVLCPLALNTILLSGERYEKQMEYAELLMMLVVQAILVTTPIGFFLTNYFAPRLLKNKRKDCQNDSEA